MRIAILADIHGNALALDAVLADIDRRGGVDGYWILGDLCAIGSDPAGVLERLTRLPNALFVQGNADRYLLEDQSRPYPSIEQAAADTSLIPELVETTASFAWTKGYVEGRGWMDWLRGLPLEQRLTLPDGARVLLVHIAPGKREGAGLNPCLSDAELARRLDGCAADLVCVGHFHLALDRTLNGTRVINPGSVSNPLPRDVRSAYAILESTESGTVITFHRVDYDRAAALEGLRRSSNPGAGFIARWLEGQMSPNWYADWDGSYYPPIVDS